MEHELYRRFGLRMRQWREKEKLTARQLAKKLSASDTYLLEQEKGSKPPTDPHSAIGQALYALLGDQPSTQERFLWTQLSANPVALRQLGFAVWLHYLPALEDLGTAKPRTLADALLPEAVDPGELFVGLGGPRTELADAHERIWDVSGGAWVDWLLQTTYQFGHVFAPFASEANSVPRGEEDTWDGAQRHLDRPGALLETSLEASLRYPLKEFSETVSVPYRF